VVSLRAQDLFSLEGRTAVLTGAAGFLGRTMGEALLANGARVIALGRSERLDEVVADWRARHGEATAVAHRVDMYDCEAFTATLERIAAEEQVDVLVNNAHEMGPATGFNVEEGRLEHADIDAWARNLTGGIVWAAMTTKHLGAGMCARRAGSIVNISSMYGVVAPSPRLYEGTDFVNPPGYSSAKAGMLGLTRYVASFWGGYGVRCNAMLPGPFSNVEDEGPNTVAGDDPFLARLAERTCLGRVGSPDELAGALVFLTSDASSYVTGHTLLVDGGWTTT
jgi:gluconate 5-dehydrogenase